MSHIFERIKNERVRAGLSEDEMAAKLGVKRSTYQYWEKVTPGVDKIIDVAKALGLPEWHFFITDDETISKLTTIPLHGPIKEELSAPHNITTNYDSLFTQLLKEKERVIQEKEKVLEKEEARRQEAEARLNKADQLTDRLMSILEGRLLNIHNDQQIALAYQKAWVELHAEEVSGGNQKQKVAVMAKMNTLLASKIKVDAKESSPVVPGT